MDKKTTLAYLNGYLEAIAMMNSFPDDGKTYDLALFPKIDKDPQKTLCHHLKAAPHEVQVEKTEEEWQKVLQKELRPYFDQIIVETYRRNRDKFNRTESGDISENEINSIKNDAYFNIEIFIENFLEHLEKLVPQTANIYRVTVNSEEFYENYYNDYLFELENEVLFLHFGSSD